MKKILLVWLWYFMVPWVLADNYSQLYRAAGWDIQIDHFHQIVLDTQQQYKNSLPDMLYQSILASSNERFAPIAMKQRGEETLRDQLADPLPALNFFNSAIGKKVVSAETKATSKAMLQNNKHGIPLIKLTKSRDALIGRLIKAIPYEQGAVSTVAVLVNLAADSLESMMPGMGVKDSFNKFVIPKQQVEQQIHNQLKNTLAYVYHDLSDTDLQSFVQFAESSAGQAYYQSALQVVNISLNIK